MRDFLKRELPDPVYDITIAIEHAKRKLDQTSGLVQRKAIIEQLQKLRKIEGRLNRNR
jgi:hypothetical protein